MSTFASRSFPTTRYAAFRPTYPPSLYSAILLPYHRGARRTAIDLGCGAGTATRALAPHFSHCIGTDPSAGMLATARALSGGYKNTSFHQAHAEYLVDVVILDGAVDIVVAAQAAHWFQPSSWWREMARVVRREGTVAAWGYGDMLLPRFPGASRVLRTAASPEGELGRFWEVGREVVRERLRSVRPPEKEWEDVVRWECEPEFEVPASAEEEAVRDPVLGDDGVEGFGKLVRYGEALMRSRMRLGEVEGYVRTWSCVHTWKEKFPERRSLEDGGEGDAVDEMMREMVEVEGWGEDWREMEVDVAWGHGMVLARKK